VSRTTRKSLTPPNLKPPWLQSFLMVGMELIMGLAFYTSGWVILWLLSEKMFSWAGKQLYFFLVGWALLSMYLDCKSPKVIDKQ
jgi:hypothetical protein